MVKDSNVAVILADLNENDLGSLLRTYNEINQIEKELDEQREEIKTKIKIFLKENKWDSYKDMVSNISVSITKQQRESVNKKILKLLLNEEQYSQAVTTTSFEKLLIVTPDDRERLKKYYGKK